MSQVTSTNEVLFFLQNNIEIKLQEAILRKWVIDILKKFSKRKEPFTPSVALSLSLMCEWIKKGGKQNLKGFNEVIIIQVDIFIVKYNCFRLVI